MDSDQKSDSYKVRAFVRGELGQKDLENLGIEIKEIKDGYEFRNPRNILVKVSLQDVAEGLLRFRHDPEALRAWAGLVVAGSSFIELDSDFEDNPEGEVLLDCLWNAWFRQDIAEDKFAMAERLLKLDKSNDDKELGY
jgi:hypothetical protein